MIEKAAIKKPNFFIVGAPKCGTTAMYDYLKQHPDIFMSEVKEPNYFGKPYPPPRDLVYDETGYLKLFSSATDEKRLGEATPGYLGSPVAAEKIYAFDPEAKIIIMLRSPVDLVYSGYFHRQSVGRELHYATFEEALFDQKNSETDVPINYSYWRRTLFCDPVQHYFEVFGRENVHIIIFDDLKNDVAQVYTDVLDFLEVDTEFQADFKIVNAAKEVKHKNLQKVLVRFGLTPQAIKYSRFSRLANFIPESVRASSLRFLRKRYMTEKKPEAMNPETRQYLQKLFLPEVQRLSLLLNRDLTYWCRDE